MDRSPRDPLTRWLEAEDGFRPGREDAEHEDRLEAALAELMQALPDHAPRPGFAFRVMREVRRPEPVHAPRPVVAPRRDPFASLWLRLSLALSLLATGLALPWVVPTAGAAGSLLPRPSAAGAVRAGADLLLELGRSLATFLDLGGSVLAFGRALATPFANLPMAAATACLLLLAAASFRLLYDLITRERSWSYADPL